MSVDAEAIGTRDMSRAHWMRSVGTVAMTELTTRFYEEQEFGSFNPDDLEDYSREVDEYLQWHTNSLTWAHAFALSRMFLPHRLDGTFVGRSPELREQMERHTHYGTPTDVLREGLLTQATFPLNLAIDVSLAAEEAGAAGFEMEDLTGIARVLRRPDFQALVHAAAFTKNAVWEHYATTPFDYYQSKSPDDPPLDFVFSENGVAFTPSFSSYLKRQLAATNRRGLSSSSRAFSGVEDLVSSGCPVQHKRPHFTDSVEDEANLHKLSEYFDKPEAELLAERETTVITDGMNRLAYLLEKAAPYVEDDNTKTAPRRRSGYYEY